MNPRPDGYNPMRWDCMEYGCFNRKKRPKIEVFAGVFPGKNAFGDIDGFVERYGNALLLEWKERPGPLPTGQRLGYERLSDDGRLTVLILAGDPRDCHVTHRAWVFQGGYDDWQPYTLEQAKRWMLRWEHWASEHPRLGHPGLWVVSS